MNFYNISSCYFTTSHQWQLSRHYLPQVQLSSHTTIKPLYFTTTLTQTFSNPTPDRIDEARYTFPLYDGVAVTGFTCTIGERVIVGRVQEKGEARQTFNEAIKGGQSAGLLDSLPLGLFSATLGNIPANQEIVVNITYGGELKHDAGTDGLRYMLPTSICPRYGQYPGEVLGAGSTVSSRGMRMIVDVDMEVSAIRKIQSPTADHPISLSLGSLSTEPSLTMPEPSKASVTLQLPTTELSTDFILQVLVDDIGSPKALLEKHPSLPGHQALMATFVPKFAQKSSNPEVVFIADQSGSMQGSSNKALVAALVTLLKSLPVGVRFNVCSFGSRHKFLWPKSQPYTSENVKVALQYVSGFSASMGGTQLHFAVEEVFSRRLGDMPLEVILLTDGKISQETPLFDFVTRSLSEIDARVFTLGIGSHVSTTLIEGLARAGRGFSQFATEHEVMDHVLDQKVVRMLKAALHPRVDNFTLELDYEESDDDFEIIDTQQVKTKLANESTQDHALRPFADQRKKTDTSANVSTKPVMSMFSELDTPSVEAMDPYAHLQDITTPSVLQIPGSHSPLFPFNRTTVYLVMDAHANRTPTSITLRAETSQGPLELSIPVIAACPGSTVHHLAIRRITHEIEEGRGWIMDATTVDGVSIRGNSRADEYAAREAVRLGVKYQIANKWCSFVAVENGKRTDDPSRSHSASGPSSLSSDTDYAMMPGNNMMNTATANCYSRRFRRPSWDSPRINASMLLKRDLPRMSSMQDDASRASVAPPLAWPSPAVSARISPREISALRGDPNVSFRQMSNMRSYDSDVLSRSPSLPALSAGPLERVRYLIVAQSFDGHWAFSDATLSIIGATAGDLSNMVVYTQDGSAMTRLVLAYLEKECKQFEGMWDMIAAKAKKWLKDEEDRTM